MGLKRRIFSRDFKLQVLREIELGKKMAQVCREHQIHPNTLRSWRKLHDQYADQAFAGEPSVGSSAAGLMLHCLWRR